MAVLPYFILSPNTVMSLIGLLTGPDKTKATPGDDIAGKTIDVVVPTYFEEKNVLLCLASLVRQTKQPRKIFLMDDGSKDATVDAAWKFGQANFLDIEIVQRQKSIGKTPSMKRQARELDCDVLFILDGDTVLDSENYLERVVEEIYKTAGKGVACVNGAVLPLRHKDRKRYAECPRIQRFALQFDTKIVADKGPRHIFLRGITNLYRSTLYMFLQRFTYRGQMAFFGTMVSPVGCAVGYRREYLEAIFDEYEPKLGDDLTNSEDIFLGFAMIDKGYRCVQLLDVLCKTEEPPINRLPRQMLKWSSAFYQSCYYFKRLVISPFRTPKRIRNRRHEKRLETTRRVIKEPYRQPFGTNFTDLLGRPVGWSILTSLVEKVSFPIALLLMAVFRWWEALAVTLLAEAVLSLLILFIIAKDMRFKFLLMGLAATPIRYFVLFFDLITLGRFASDILISGNRRWRK